MDFEAAEARTLSLQKQIKKVCPMTRVIFFLQNNLHFKNTSAEAEKWKKN